jgi:membrane associated rhomboid family serine protease
MSLPPPVITYCYRHPNREAGRSCTRCGRSACGDCLVQASIGSHCVDCVKAAKPDVKTRAKFWNARQPTLVTYVLIAINVAVFIWMVITDTHTLSGDATRAHFDLGLNRGILAYDHNWYRLVTAGFIHFGPLHIAFNMLLLYQLGQLLEPALDRVKFTLLYFAALLGGSLAALAFQPNGLSGGASGAVFGLMTAAAIGLHRRGVNVFSTGIGTTLILNVVITFGLGSRIGWSAHLGGAVVGAVCGFVLLAPPHKPMPKWAGYAVPAVIGVASVIASVVVVG